jgi:hypothetical protein
MDFDSAVQKIIEHIAQTGKPVREAIEYLWKEIALDQSVVEQLARRHMEGSFFCKNSVSEALDQELRRYSERMDEAREVLSSEEIEKVINVMVPLFGRPNCLNVDEPQARRIAWEAKDSEPALQMCTLISNLGLKCYCSRRSGTSVRIYGPWTDRKKVNELITKLGRSRRYEKLETIPHF